jgi:hypothetical protein
MKVRKELILKQLQNSLEQESAQVKGKMEVRLKIEASFRGGARAEGEEEGVREGGMGSFRRTNIKYYIMPVN